MEKLPATGKAKAIGVSNHSVPFLEKLLAEATIVPAANQIENHPQLAQQEIVDFCKSKGILIEAYSPLGSTGSPLFTAEPVVEIAKKRNVSPATVLLSWHCMFPPHPVLLTCNTDDMLQWLVAPSSSQNQSTQTASPRTGNWLTWTPRMSRFSRNMPMTSQRVGSRRDMLPRHLALTWDSRISGRFAQAVDCR